MVSHRSTITHAPSIQISFSAQIPVKTQVPSSQVSSVQLLPSSQVTSSQGSTTTHSPSTQTSPSSHSMSSQGSTVTHSPASQTNPSSQFTSTQGSSARGQPVRPAKEMSPNSTTKADSLVFIPLPFELLFWDLSQQGFCFCSPYYTIPRERSSRFSQNLLRRRVFFFSGRDFFGKFTGASSVISCSSTFTGFNAGTFRVAITL